MKQQSQDQRTRNPPPARRGMKAFARATFQGYKSQPGEIQLRMPAAPIEVEVFRFRADTWKARAVHGGGIFKGIEGPVEVAMRQTVERFDQIIKPWQWVDEDGDPAEAANEPNLRHLLGAPKDQQQFPRIRRTLCGKTVMAHRIAHRLEDANCAPCRLALTNMPAE